MLILVQVFFSFILFILFYLLIFSRPFIINNVKKLWLLILLYNILAFIIFYLNTKNLIVTFLCIVIINIIWFNLFSSKLTKNNPKSLLLPKRHILYFQNRLKQPLADKTVIEYNFYISSAYYIMGDFENAISSFLATINKIEILPDNIKQNDWIQNYKCSCIIGLMSVYSIKNEYEHIKTLYNKYINTFYSVSNFSYILEDTYNIFKVIHKDFFNNDIYINCYNNLKKRKKYVAKYVRKKSLVYYSILNINLLIGRMALNLGYKDDAIKSFTYLKNSTDEYFYKNYAIEQLKNID